MVKKIHIESKQHHGVSDSVDLVHGTRFSDNKQTTKVFCHN